MATTTSILTNEIMAQAKAFSEARSAWEDQFNAYAHGVPPLAPEHFWPMVEDFRKVLLDTLSYRRERTGKAAANEFMRQIVVGQLDYSFAAGVHFCLSWDRYEAKAYAAGDRAGFSFDRGDDSYGDLMDALPILGQDTFDKLVAGKFASLREFNESVDAACDQAGRVLVNAVLHGENYFAMHLEEAAQKWLVLESRKNGKDGG